MLDRRGLELVPTTGSDDPAFSRAGTTYDVDLLAGRTLVGVGVGGAAGFYEDLARAGVGRFVLIDPDRVELVNVDPGGFSRRCRQAQG